MTFAQRLAIFDEYVTTDILITELTNKYRLSKNTFACVIKPEIVSIYPERERLYNEALLRKKHRTFENGSRRFTHYVTEKYESKRVESKYSSEGVMSLAKLYASGTINRMEMTNRMRDHQYA